MESDLRHLSIPELEAFPGLSHAFFTRQADVLSNPHPLPVSSAQSFLVQQVHGTNVLVLDQDNATKIQPEDFQADAVVTDLKGLPLGVLTADCVPIIFYDPNRDVIGIAHLGWRGTLGNLAQGTVESMIRNFQCRPEDIRAALGPAIGPCCYYLDEAVAQQFQKAFPYFSDFSQERKEGGFWLDLVAANATALKEAGLKKSNIFSLGICTCCRQDLFFSYRGSKGQCGRQLSVVVLKTS